MSNPIDVTPIIPAGRQVIDTYGPGLFRISNAVYGHAVLVFPDRTVRWDATGFGDLTVEDFALAAAEVPRIEILLVGCGPKMLLMPSALRRALKERGIAADVMDTGAACRTYNILLSEERRVAAALFPV